MFRRYLLPWVVFLFYRVWSLTWRVRVVATNAAQLAIENQEPLIFAHWHGDELKILPLVGRYKIATMTSTSKDGDLIAFALKRLGGATSRGSSTRGGSAALRGLVRLVRQGYRASIAVDGPKGPLHKVKPGIFELSKLVGAKIIPVGAMASSVYRFEKSWNKAELPLPFSKIVVYFGEPVPAILPEAVSRDSSLASHLEDALGAACLTAKKDPTIAQLVL